MANLPSKTKVNELMQLVQSRAETFRELLPKYLPAERLFRIAQLSISKNPAILACSPGSFVLAMMDCARAGLEPDGKHAALVPYGNTCQFQPMYQGLIKQAVSRGVAKKIESRLVYANDTFRIWYDPEPHILHEPATDDEGELIGAYAYAILPDGNLQVEWMNRRKLDHIKAKSKGSSAWKTDEEEMHRKSPIKRLFKFLPLPEELEYAVTVDDMAESGKNRDDMPIIDLSPGELQEPAKTRSDQIKDRLREKRGKSSPENPTSPEPTKGNVQAPGAEENATTGSVAPSDGDPEPWEMVIAYAQEGNKAKAQELYPLACETATDGQIEAMDLALSEKTS